MVSFQTSSLSWNIPNIKSMLIRRGLASGWTRLHSASDSRRISYAFTALAELCLRFIQRRIPSSKLWMPMLTLVTPSPSRPETYSLPFSTISSGFTSIVNSFHGAANSGMPIANPGLSKQIFSTIRDKTFSGSTEGVPPPT